MPLPELAWPDGAEVSGEAMILTHAIAETQLTFAAADRRPGGSGGGCLAGVHGPASLPEKSCVFLRGAGFWATITTREVPVVFDAGWVISAVVNETWIQLTYHVEVEVKRSALRQAVVEIPAAVPELRWEGEALRSVRAVVEGGSRIYTLTFQEDVTEFASLIASTELPWSKAVPGCLIWICRRLASKLSSVFWRTGRRVVWRRIWPGPRRWPERPCRISRAR